MTKLYTLLCAICLAGTAQAQITLDAAAFANVNITSDTFGQITNGRPVLQPSTSAQTLDLTNIRYENIRYYSIQAPGTNAAFPSATFWETRGYTHGADSFDTKRWSGVTPNGIIRFGEEIERQVVNLHGVSGGTVNDSLEILAQNAAYSSDYKLIPFPTTLGNSWNNDFSYEVNMLLTYAAGSYVQAPFKLVSHVKYNFEAIGYGHVEMIKLDESFGQADVLLVRVSSETVDSFFLNGSPAPMSLLSGMGITQGRISKLYFDELFRANEVTPLLLYNYGSDASFTNVTGNQLHQLRLPFATSISTLTKEWYPEGKDVLLYPNAISTGIAANLYLPNAIPGNYTYTITGIDGKVVSKANHMIEKNGKALIQIDMPAAIASGTYRVALYNAAGKQITVQPLSYTAQ